MKHDRSTRGAAAFVSDVHSRPKFRALANKYEAWSASPAGIEAMLAIAFGALGRAAGKLSAEQQASQLAALSTRTGVPLSDLKLMARIAAGAPRPKINIDRGRSLVASSRGG